MNAPASNLPAKVPMRTGGQIAALIPQSMEEAFRVANAIAMSGLAPKGLDKPEQVLVAIMAGAELGMAPFQSLQSFAVINGKPAIWGDGLMAVVRSNGFKVREWIEGDGETLTAHCEVTRPDNGEIVLGDFSVAKAKKAGLWGKSGPWQQYPERMLKMRARAFALRDGAADVLRGFQMREEVEDYQPIREVREQQATGMRARLEARTSVGGFDPEHIETELAEAHGEVDPNVDQPAEADVSQIAASDEDENRDTAPDLPPMKTGAQLLAEQTADQEAGSANNGPGDGQAEEVDILDWAASFNRGLAELPAVQEVADAWSMAKKNGFVAKLKEKSPGMAKNLADAVNARVAQIEADNG